ncbi:MAG TPA: alpha-amylase [Deltaproteobacteria bacterium]|nr:alpha-amylase [Deltaproteobacteria bacterium]
MRVKQYMFEFHISKSSRDIYGFDESLFSTSGNVIFADFAAARRFADKMNAVRNAARYPERAVKASEINAMGLIDEILHYMVELYRRTVNKDAIAKAYVSSQINVGDVDETLKEFIEIFPAVPVFKKIVTSQQYIDSNTMGVPNTHIALEEMILLYVSNMNPAYQPYIELFDDTILEERTRYCEIIRYIEKYFANQPGFGPYGQNLLDLLMAPAKAAPGSLFDQLEYIRIHWGRLISELLIRILGGIDFLKEESKPRFLGPGPAFVPRFTKRDLEEVERFSPDEDWMPHLVLIAKTVYVWLYQLSKMYGTQISRLDQIPDRELEKLAGWGFTGLWLIGIWERSPASKRIKQITGNPEAAASAYSIYDYVIAQDLGGKDAFEKLKARARGYGIRIGTDMVPNHMGIYSKWVIEHPERFLQLEHSPFPSYSFTGENLSKEDRVEIRIENGYWDRRDAAVVFQRKDKYTGDVRYIYHGNDGTSMPWNDTAQLDFLKHEVREAVIRTTIEIAKDFPIIRFDAAMTLAKRHFQRLWYPLPGYGGDIPSRAGQDISQEDFDREFPVEFWRELVDRVAIEAPNTLLLAEAFWLMEGYFVRSLGMHRVYNSAFMNMLKTEENSKYRDVIKNVLRFNPEILRRFVNFMNNPDEEPAAEQFGKQDKYFGVATMMVTMPGLPMFGHGQIEGFCEKYGMEYTRSYWEESIDEDLVERHERELFPLLKKRHLFSGVEHFVLYDVFTKDGHVNEDVFAYSNMYGNERALVVYNNRYAQAAGWIRRSVGISVSDSGKRRIVNKSLGESLNLIHDDTVFYLFRDMQNGNEFLRSSVSMCTEGLYINLGAFKVNVFCDFREMKDHDGQLRRLHDMLGGRGVPDVMGSLNELYLEKVLNPFKELLSADLLFHTVIQGRSDKSVPDGYEKRLLYFISQASEQAGCDVANPGESICGLVEALLSIDELRQSTAGKTSLYSEYLFSRIPEGLSEDLSWWRVTLVWSTICRLGLLFDQADVATRSRALMDEWMLKKEIVRLYMRLGLDERSAGHEQLLVGILTRYQGWEKDILTGDTGILMRTMLSDSDVRTYIGANEFEGRWWYNKESMEDLLYWLYTVSAIQCLFLYHEDSRTLHRHIRRNHRLVEKIITRSNKSGFDIEVLIDSLDKKARKKQATT